MVWQLRTEQPLCSRNNSRLEIENTKQATAISRENAVPGAYGQNQKSDHGHSAWEAQNGRADRESTQNKILVRVGTGAEREQGIPKIPSTQTTEASQK
jgi:hypothetical protein